MQRRFIGPLVALLLLAAVPAALAQGFARVGPVGFGGYPSWYQDKTGLALDFCSPLNPSELDGGWCLLLTGDTVAPESFPSQFFDEHFYWAANADASANGTKALLVMALEGAFAVGPVVQGDQIVFGRLRIVVNPLPVSGTYTVYTPFGKYSFPNQVAGDKLFFTEDIGIQCLPGDFTCALQAKIGPFLLPSAAPGGAEMPPVTAANPTPDTDPAHFGGAFAPTAYPGTGKAYIADPARIGPVTGSPYPPFESAVDHQIYNHNIFRIERPDGIVMQTAGFSLMGRAYTGAVGGHVTVDRAVYARSATATKVDVFATAFPGTQARIPAGPAPTAVMPQLQYFDAPCAANLDAQGKFISWGAPLGTATQMLSANGSTIYWGQSAPADVPVEVCVMQTNAVDASGSTTSAFFPTVLGDQIFITEALYDPENQALSVKASSSDQLTAPTLTVTGFGSIDSATGQLLISPLVAPPASVHVTSSALGANQMQVATGVGGSGPGATVPIAVNDSVAIVEDSPATMIQVLGNDTIGGNPIPGGSIVTLTALSLRGTVAVNVDGTISYTPNPNANGPDAFTYTVTVNGIPSNVASVDVQVAAANDAPVALGDSFNAIANASVALPVAANDFDLDGPADIVAVANLTQGSAPAGAVWSITASGNTVNFVANTPGAYSFTYRAQDLAGATSNLATANVSVAGAETVTITLTEYRRSSRRLRLTGTVSPVAAPPQRLEVRWANGTNTVSVVATPVADAAGNWAVDLRGVTGIQNPDNSGATQVRVSSPGGGSATRSISFR